MQDGGWRLRLHAGADVSTKSRRLRISAVSPALFSASLKAMGPIIGLTAMVATTL